MYERYNGRHGFPDTLTCGLTFTSVWNVVSSIGKCTKIPSNFLDPFYHI